MVGIVGNVRHFTLGAEARPEMYFPLLQPLERDPVDSETLAEFRMVRYVSVVMRIAAEPEGLAAAVRNEVWSLDRDQPILQLATMNDMLLQAAAPRKLNMLVFGVFAGVALLLAAIGIYGVMAYSAAQRTHEIGIRLALGAKQADVLSLVVGQGLTLALIGVGIGLAASFALTRVMTSLLFDAGAADPLTFGLVSALLTGVALAACFVPARRAAKVDPMVALRYE